MGGGWCACITCGAREGKTSRVKMAFPKVKDTLIKASKFKYVEEIRILFDFVAEFVYTELGASKIQNPAWKVRLTKRTKKTNSSWKTKEPEVKLK